jgi:membrane-associated phospholipid phosphatase
MAMWPQLSPSMPAMTIATDPTNSASLTSTIVAFNSPWRWGVPLLAMAALLVLLLVGCNVDLFYFINRLASHASDGLWIHLSLLGDGLLVILFVTPFFGRRPDVVWQYILAWIFAGIFVPVMKESFSSLRPPGSLSLDSFHLIGPALQNNAFPSGHTTAIFVLAGLVCLQRTDKLGKFGVWIKFGALLLAIMVGLSRIANGVHWPVDVLGAAMGGWLIAIAAVWLAQYWRAGMNVWAQRVFALILTPVSVWAVWSLWHKHADVYPGTDVMKVLLLVACLALSIPGQLRLFNLRQ